MDNKQDVFISHARRDKDLARALRAALRSKGISSWDFLQDDIPASGSTAHDVFSAMRVAKCIVILVTKRFLESDWCRAEASSAVQLQIENRAVVYTVCFGVKRSRMIQALPELQRAVHIELASGRVLDPLVGRISAQIGHGPAVETVRPAEVERETTALFRLMSSQVELDLSFAPLTVLRGLRRSPPHSIHRMLILCIENEEPAVTKTAIKDFVEIVTAERAKGTIDEGKIVRDGGVELPQHVPAWIGALSLQELRDALFDTEAYLHAISASEEHRHFLSRQAETAAHQLVPDICAYLKTFVNQPPPRLLVLTGGIGAGKTWAMAQVNREIAEQHLRNKERPAPVLVPLIEYAGAARHASILQYIADSIGRVGGNHQIAPSHLEALLSSGRLVLLLDGFDEICGLDSPLLAERELRNLLSGICNRATTIISCRDTILGSRRALEDLVLTQVGRDEPSLVAELAFLSPLSKPQANQYLVAHGVPSDLITQWLSDASLTDICGRPILLSLLASEGTRRAADRPPTTQPEIIDRAINSMISYRQELESGLMSSADWWSFFEEAALEMIVGNLHALSGDQIEKLLRTRFGDKFRFGDLQRVFADARIRTVFDAARGGLKFAHDIFRSWLMASGLARRILSPRSDDARLHLAMIPYEAKAFIPDAIKLKCQDLSSTVPDGERPNYTNAGQKILEWVKVPQGLGIVAEHGVSGPLGYKLFFFSKAFWISKFPVTIGQLRQAEPAMERTIGFLAQRSLRNTNEPLTSVTHDEAAQICQELFGGRLPTEPEWEKAVRSLDGGYPHKEQIPKRDGRDALPEVGTSQPNPLGVHDGTGLVWNWTSTEDPSTGSFFCKGGWWGKSSASKLDPGIRLKLTEPKHIRTGFRVVLD